jgi:hypothetical protein
MWLVPSSFELAIPELAILELAILELAIPELAILELASRWTGYKSNFVDGKLSISINNSDNDIKNDAKQ